MRNVGSEDDGRKGIEGFDMEEARLFRPMWYPTAHAEGFAQRSELWSAMSPSIVLGEVYGLTESASFASAVPGSLDTSSSTAPWPAEQMVVSPMLFCWFPLAPGSFSPLLAPSP